MHPCVCFEASRLTLTQSSWTTLSQGRSRKWMSGYAAVPLAAPSDRGPRISFTLTALGEPVPPSEGESPFPLDFYLSWMSRISNSTPINGNDFTDENVTAGVEYFYLVTAVVSDDVTQSAASNEAAATVPST